MPDKVAAFSALADTTIIVHYHTMNVIEILNAGGLTHEELAQRMPSIVPCSPMALGMTAPPAVTSPHEKRLPSRRSLCGQTLRKRDHI